MQLDRLGRLDRADHAGQHAEHAALGARRHRAGRRRRREEAPVARRLLAGHEDRCLALELIDRAVHERLAHELGGVVHQVADREVVGAVDDHVVGLHHVEHVRREEQGVVADDLDRRVDRAQMLEGGLDLGPADVGVRVQDLALEVGDVDARRSPRCRSCPTPAAARYIAIGEPSPPAPMISTLESSSLRCPAPPTLGRMMCRE